MKLHEHPLYLSYQPDAEPLAVCHTDCLFDGGTCQTDGLDNMLAKYPKVVALYLDELFRGHLDDLGCEVPPEGYFQEQFLQRAAEHNPDVAFCMVWDMLLFRIMDAGYPVFEGDSEYLYFEAYPKDTPLEEGE